MPPGCSPSRNALLFGLEPFNSGHYAFYGETVFTDEFRERHKPVPEFFKNNGYNTFASGKIHHGYPRTSEQWNEYHEKKKVTDYDGPRFDDVEGYIQGKDSKMRFSPSLYPLEDHPDYQFAQFGIDVLKREHDKPFFLAVGLRLFGGELFTVNRTVFCCLACDLEIPPVDRMHCFAVN